MPQAESVRGLADRFEQLQGQRKPPPIAAKPRVIAPKAAHVRPLPERSDSLLSDPFGSPVESPRLDTPQLAFSKDVINERPSIDQEVDSAKLYPSRPSSAATNGHRPSIKPPVPSPRQKSPRTQVRQSVEYTRPPSEQESSLVGNNLSVESLQLQPRLPQRPTYSRQASDEYRPRTPVSRPCSQNSTSSAKAVDGERTIYTGSSPMRGKSPFRPNSIDFSRSPSKIEDKPILPTRPISVTAITPIIEFTSPKPPEMKPELPRRMNMLNSVPPSSIRNSMDAPRLPVRLEGARTSSEHIRAPSTARYSSETTRSTEGQRTVSSRTTASAAAGIESDDEEPAGEVSRSNEQPDASTANRKPPRFKGSNWDINTGKEIRRTAICGDQLLMAHSDKMKLHNVLTNESVWQIPVVDTRVTAMEFRTVNAKEASDHGRFIWVGFKDGSLHEIDIRSRTINERYFHCHSSAIIAIMRAGRAMWTLDEGGSLYIWSDAEAISLRGRPSYRTMRTPFGCTSAIVVGSTLWLGCGRTVHVLQPKTSEKLTHDRGLEPNRVTGNITCAVHLPHQPELVYFGHDDGKISVYTRDPPRFQEVLSLSHYSLSGLLSVGDYLWASFKTGKVFVYDVHTRPWTVMKEWAAHKSPITELLIDRSGLWREKRLQVSTTAADGSIRIWDGLLMDDWLDAQMQRRQAEYSTYRPLQALVCTWNAGASLPSRLSRNHEDAQFIEAMIRDAGSPDLIVFGFQELVDLDDKGKASRSVAKGLFGKKKEKEPDEKVTAIAYQQWQNHLEKQVSIVSSTEDGYYLFQVRNLVGLFSCVFAKRSLQARIRSVDAASVKTGLKGRYGNKGGIVLRLAIDDTSMCLVNCHLAAGQKHVTGRNNDIFSILDQAGLPAAGKDLVKNNVFVCGGDGTMVLDHEVCILSGDLNYRINGQRSTVIQAIKEGHLPKLLEADQLSLELKKNATHRLRSFAEGPIRFPPTYKYDPGTDNYDTSEKMRVPAWCDRIFFRGLGSSQVQCQSYQALTCRVSDHRPVSALLTMRVKTVDQGARKEIYADVVDQWIDLANKTIIAKKIWVLKEVTGKTERECREALKRTPGQVVADAALQLL